MMDSILENKLKETFESCDTHVKRMIFAKSKIIAHLPVSIENYYSLMDEHISFMDQFVYRFSKLQDVMGSRLFPFLLNAFAETTDDKAFIDILNRLERFEIINSTQTWLQLRKIRNDIAHEYPSSLLERLAGINILFDELETFQAILENCRRILLEKVNIRF